MAISILYCSKYHNLVRPTGVSITNHGKKFMENLKQISVRIDPVTLQKIDDFCKKHYYWKRNTVINALLGAVVDGMADDTLYEMVRYTRHFHDKPKGTFIIPKNDSL